MGAFPILPLALVIIGCVILYQFLRAFHEMYGCWKWPAAEGKVLRSCREMRTRSHAGRLKRMEYAKVLYEYKVDGKTYQSTRIYFGPELGGTLASRKAFKYPEGATVAVRYNPKNPSEAVLERNAPAMLFLLGIVVFIVFLSSLGSGMVIPLKGCLPQFPKSGF